jgi:hypothetical protein
MNTLAYALLLYAALVLPIVFLFRRFSLSAKKTPLSYLLLAPLPLSAPITYLLAIALWPAGADGGVFLALVFLLFVFVVAIPLAVLAAIFLFRAFARLRRP